MRATAAGIALQATLIAALRTAASVTSVSLYVLLLGPPVLLWTLIVRNARLLYARAGIREYWVVDINGRRLLVNRDPQAGDYSTQHAHGLRDAVSPLAAPTAVVRVADLLV